MKIWIDLTDFLSWHGNLTGIQRIQYNISKLYIKSKKDVHFFVYNEQTRSFHEVGFEPEKVVAAGVVVDCEKNINRPQISKRQLRSFGKKLIPQSILQKAKKINIQNVNVFNVHTNCIFSEGDTVLILGGIWAGNFINDLALCKRKKNFKLIHFAFDMIPSYFPGYVVDWLPEAFNIYFKKVYEISEGILAISKSTANDALNFMHLHSVKNKPKIQVVRISEGIDALDAKNNDSLAKIIGNNFILSVSTIEGRKNHASLFYALKEAKARNLELPKIVIVGRDGWLTNDIRYMMKNDLDARKQIIMLNNINDNELDWLYKNCLFTIFPSFYEGWGMPVAESLAYGKLCLSSNTSSMPEIAGDLIDYFSPYDTGSMLDCIKKYLKPAERKKKEDLIKRNYRSTSWEEMYEEVDKFVQYICKTPNK